MTSQIYFITGVTGFLGGEVLRTILTQDPQAQCYCLIRKQKHQSATQRLQQLGITQELHRVFAVTGDITLDQLGLNPDEYQALAQKITHIVHVAANIKFEKPKSVLMRCNVYGTENIIHFAQTCQKLNPDFQVLGHVSTAYVAGLRNGLVTEHDFSDAYGFKNHYESSKYTAEALVRAAKNTLPVMIFRPSMILGHSRDGESTRNNVIFPLVWVAKKLKVNLCPINKNCLLDFVAVDTVATELYHLLQAKSAIGQTFHLTCGLGNEVSVRQYMTVLNNVLQLHIKIIPASLWPICKYLFLMFGGKPAIVNNFEPYRGYTVKNPQFCAQNTQKMLGPNASVKTDGIMLLQKTISFMQRTLLD